MELFLGFVGLIFGVIVLVALPAMVVRLGYVVTHLRGIKKLLETLTKKGS